MRTLALDASPLHHLARANELSTLEQVLRGRRCVVTAAVLEEIANRATQHPELTLVKDLPWLETVSLTTLDEMYAFAQYMQRLGSTERNAGEATILAWAEVNDADAFIDDQAAYNVARSRGVTVYRTLNLVLREQLKVFVDTCCYAAVDRGDRSYSRAHGTTRRPGRARHDRPHPRRDVGAAPPLDRAWRPREVQ